MHEPTAPPAGRMPESAARGSSPAAPAGSTDATTVSVRRPSAAFLATLALGVLAIAFAGYAWKGSPALAVMQPISARMASASEGAGAGASASDLAKAEEIAAMVEQLAARMKDRPGDVEGWTMLGRAYAALGRFHEAAMAYRHASGLQPKNADLLADLAEALVADDEGRWNDAAREALARALAANGDHPKALALAAASAFVRGDYALAATHWKKLAAALPLQSDVARWVEANIAEAEARMKLGAPSAARQPLIDNGLAVSGIVSVVPELRSSIAPGDTLFVFVRAVGSNRMPLAVQRGKAGDLPLVFRLDDSMAMTPGTRLSDAGRLVVGARISKSGSAMPQPGDLYGDAAPVAPGASGIEVSIRSVVGR